MDLPTELNVVVMMKVRVASAAMVSSSSSSSYACSREGVWTLHGGLLVKNGGV